MASETVHFTSNPTTTVPVDDPFSRLIRRLEAATSRLEDIAQSSSDSIEHQAHGPNGSISAASGEGMPKSSSMPELPKGGSREASTGTVIRSAQEGDEDDDEEDGHTTPKEELPERIKEMDELIENELKEFTASSRGIDSLVEEQVCRPQIRGLIWRS